MFFIIMKDIMPYFREQIFFFTENLITLPKKIPEFDEL